MAKHKELYIYMYNVGSTCSTRIAAKKVKYDLYAIFGILYIKLSKK